MWFVIFQEWLSEQIQKQGLTYEELAERSGISKSYISTVLTGKKNVTRNFCVSIAKGLDLDAVYVLSIAGLIDKPSNLDIKNQEIHEALKKMSDDKLRTVLRFTR